MERYTDEAVKSVRNDYCENSLKRLCASDCRQSGVGVRTLAPLYLLGQGPVLHCGVSQTEKRNFAKQINHLLCR